MVSSKKASVQMQEAFEYAGQQTRTRSEEPQWLAPDQTQMSRQREASGSQVAPGDLQNPEGSLPTNLQAEKLIVGTQLGCQASPALTLPALKDGA